VAVAVVLLVMMEAPDLLVIKTVHLLGHLIVSVDPEEDMVTVVTDKVTALPRKTELMVVPVEHTTL
jgi:hypothetical protein